VRELLQQLSELAATTAHDVGEHSTRMQNVSEQISAVSSLGEDPLRASLLAAAAQMLEANEQLQAELAETKAELHGHTKRVEVLMTEARIDALTGVANRRALDEELARCYAAWQRQGRPLSLLILDVDHFKKFNDTYGHPAGDEVLRNIGRVLAASVREMDFVARYGGEEFAFVLPGTRLEDAKSAAERIRNGIAQAKVPFSGKDLQVTVSVGLAELHPGDTVASLLKHADTALYAAKSNGRNRSYYYDGGTCRTVDSAAVAARAEVAKVVRQQLVEVASDDESTDRRTQARYSYPRVQSIAPYVAGRAPAADEFREVQCRDLTSGGISFWLPSPPEFSSLVVALGKDGTLKHLLAEVSHTAVVRNGDKTVCLVGCRFTERLDLDGAPGALATANSTGP
jgi:diguanylate cyclase